MAVTASHLTNNFSNSDANSYTTDSITPTANRLVLCAVLNARGATATTPTVTGCGLTWDQVATVGYDVGGNVDFRRLTVFRAMGASPSTEALTIAFGGVTQTSGVWCVDEFDGIDTGGTNGSAAVVQSVVNEVTGDTTLTVTLAAFGDAGNATYGAFGHNANELSVEGSGFTQLGENKATTPAISLITEFRNDNDTSVDASWTTSSGAAGIAIEIKAAAAGATNLVIADATHAHTADNQTLTQVHSLAVADATHAHPADNVVLDFAGALVIQDASHAHTADNQTLAQVHVLAVQEATHVHRADNLSPSATTTAYTFVGGPTHNDWKFGNRLKPQDVRFWDYFGPQPSGKTVIRTGGIWEVVAYPSTTRINAADDILDESGFWTKAVLFGGHESPVSQAIAEELDDQGFGAFIASEEVAA